MAKASITATVSAPTKPVINSFFANPGVVSSGGGTTGLAANVAGASTCTFTSTMTFPGLPATVPCSTGSASVSVSFPANTGSSPVTYTFGLTAENANGVSTTSNPATAVVAAARPVGTFDVSGTLSGSETWSPLIAQAYVITNDLVIPAGVTLTVAPGAVVKSSGGSGETNPCSSNIACSLSVQGTLEAVGTSADPITFTSINDNSVGGDTGSGSPSAGDWNGIYLGGSGSLDVVHATMEYGNAEGYLVTGGGSTVTLVNDAIGGPLNLSANGNVTVSSDVIQIPSTYASASSSISSGEAAVINANTVDDGSLAIGGATVEMEDNTVTDPGGPSGDNWMPPFSADSAALDLATLTGDSASGPGVLGFALSGTLMHSGTWPAGPLPLLLGVVGGDALNVSSGVTLTLAAGSIVKATDAEDQNQAGCPVPFGDAFGACDLSVEGALTAVGTSADPITFTSINDNSVGGDTGSGSPSAGDWNGIYLGGSGSLDVVHATMEYGNAEGYLVTGGGSTVTLVNDAIGGPLNLSANGNVTVSSDVIQIPSTYASASSSISSGEAAVINANTVDDGSLAIGGATVEMEDNTVTDPGGPSGDNWMPPFSADSAALDLATLTGDSASGPGVLGFALSGTLMHSGTWPAGPLPLLLGVVGGDALNVSSGVTLTLAAGSIVKATDAEDQNQAGCPVPFGDAFGACDLSVEGALTAVGTSADPITFTSINDNSVGGDTGSGSPSAGDWNGITGTTTASIDIEYATLKYASTAADFSGGSGETIKINADEFLSNSTAVSVSVAVDSNISITNNQFVGNETAIDVSSNWTTATISPVECSYIPTMTATGNEFGPSLSPDPLVSQSDYDTIIGGTIAGYAGLPVETYPDGWTDDLAVGTSDLVSWSVQGCIDVAEPEDSYVAITIPLNLTGGPINGVRSGVAGSP